MAILDTRIDDRLIHGQVCGYWIPQYSLQRIAIVDDDIVNDETRKTTLKFGMPENCKLSIFGSAKAADKFIRKIDEGIKVMILCNSPVPILRMAEAGYQVPYITILEICPTVREQHRSIRTHLSRRKRKKHFQNWFRRESNCTYRIPRGT